MTSVSTNGVSSKVVNSYQSPESFLPDEITLLFLRLDNYYWNNYSLVSKQWYGLICTLERELQVNVIIEAKKRFIEQQSSEGKEDKEFEPKVDSIVSSVKSTESLIEIRKAKKENVLALHQLACEALERAYPLLKVINKANWHKSYHVYVSDLSLPENTLKVLLTYWEKCWYLNKGIFASKLAVTNWASIGLHLFALKILNYHELFPLNRNWKIEGQIQQNSHYNWIRCATFRTVVLCLVQQKKTVELLLLLGREFRDLIRNKLFWGSLVEDHRIDFTPHSDKIWKQEARAKCLKIGSTDTTNEIKARFASFCLQVTADDIYDLILGLALLFPEKEEPYDDDYNLSSYFQALEGVVADFTEDSLELKKCLEHLSIIVNRINYDQNKLNEDLDLLEQIDYKIEKGFRECDYIDA